MELRLEPALAEDVGQIKGLFKRAFPPEERPPFFLLTRRVRQGKGQMLAAHDGGTFVGFVYLVCHLDMAYLFFLAIEEAQRGKGYGTAVLRLLQKQYAGKRIFLAREQLDQGADNSTQRVKRRQFYLRAGFEDWPLQIKEASVVYDVMGMGGQVTAEEYSALIAGWTGRLLGRLVDMRMLEKP